MKFRKFHKRVLISDALIATTLAFFLIACLVPIVNTIAISFSGKIPATTGKVGLWPIDFTIAPYAQIWNEKQFFVSFMNSVYRVALGLIINASLTVLMAYPLSRNREYFKAKNIYMWFLVFTMLFHGGLVPSFLLIRNLGLINSIWSLVLPGAVPVFSVIILMNYIKTIPASLEESALVDGANPFTILLNVIIPLAKPAIAAIVLFSIVYHWNAFFDGRIYINEPAKVPLQTYIQSLSAQLDYSNMTYMDPEAIAKKMQLTNLTFNCAKIVVSMIPILIIYPLLQKGFVSGIIMGAVKE